MLVLISFQVVRDLLDQCTEQIVSCVSHLEVLKGTQLQRALNQLHRLGHDLIGKQARVLSHQLHCRFHDAPIVHILNRLT